MPLSPELEAALAEFERNKGKPKEGPVDNPLKSPTVQELLKQEETDTAPNAAGRAAANAFVGGFGPKTLPYLQKYFEQPLRKVASTIRESVGASPLPDVPVNTEEELNDQLARDKEKHPIASGLGAGAVEGVRTAAGAAMMPFAAPAIAGAGILPRMAQMAGGGLPASVGKRVGEVVRGEKTGGEATADIGQDTVINALTGGAGSVVGRVGAGGRMANAPGPFSSEAQTLALQKGRDIMPAFKRQMTAEAGPPGGPPGVLQGVGTAAAGATKPYSSGILGAGAEMAAHAAGLPYAVGGMAGIAAPGVIAGLKQIGQNVGSRSASQVLGLLANRPDLVLKLAGNPTLYQQAIEALMSGTTSELAAP